MLAPCSPSTILWISSLGQGNYWCKGWGSHNTLSLYSEPFGSNYARTETILHYGFHVEWAKEGNGWPKQVLTSCTIYHVYDWEGHQDHFSKDHKHESLHLRPRSGDAPLPPHHHVGATRNPRNDPSSSSAPLYSSSSHRVHSDSFIKRAL